MSTRFLTPEWVDLLTAALNSDDGFRSQTARRRSVIRWSISGAPDGEVDYYIDIDHGKAQVGLGVPSTAANLNMSCGYETIVGVITGVITGRDAFQGKLMRADVRLINVLRYLGVFHEVNRVMAGMDVEY